MDADIIIAGAGIAGGATAYHLHRLGQKRVILLEKEESPGTHSTARNAAILREAMDDDDMQALASESAAAIRTGEFGAFQQTGGLFIGQGDEEVSRRCPLANGRGLWRPGDGVMDPAGMVQVYLRGQQVLCNTEVLGWEQSPHGVIVRTSNGPLSARIVVNAAGPWAGTLGELPLDPKNRHLFVTPAMNNVDPAMPFVWDDERGVYFRPDGGGLLLSPCDEQSRSPGDYRINPEAQLRLYHALSQSQPQLANIAIKSCWTGQRTFAADRRFVIGFDPHRQFLFHVAGLGGHGITTSYAVGRMAARMLVGDLPGYEHAFAPGRLTQPSLP